MTAPASAATPASAQRFDVGRGPCTLQLLGENPWLGATVAGWLRQAWPADYTPAEARETARRMNGLFAAPMAWVACEGALPVGMVALMPALSPEQAGITALTSLYVTPERRGRGIATRLCAEAVRAAAGIGLAELFLYTRDRQSFYAERGWRRECEAIVLDDPARPEVTFMQLRLHSTED